MPGARQKARARVLALARQRRWELYRLRQAAKQNDTGNVEGFTPPLLEMDNLHEVAVGSTSTTDMEENEDIKCEVVVKEEVCTSPEAVDMEGEHSFEALTGDEEEKAIKIELSEDDPNRTEEEDPSDDDYYEATRPFHFHNADGVDVDSDTQTPAPAPVVQHKRTRTQKYRRKTRLLPQSDTRSKMQNQDELTFEIKGLEFSGPLTSLPNPKNSMEHHCLICYNMLIDIEADGGTSQTSSGDNALHGNLNVMVILRNLLHVPSKDLEACLRHCGNPTNWLRICAECQPLIQNALSLNDKLMKVSKQLDKCRELIVEQMRDSFERNNVTFRNSGKCSTCDTDGCRGHEKYITDKIRKFVSKKKYPVTTNPYQEGDRKAREKVARLATLALPNWFLEKVVKSDAIRVEDMSCSWSGSDDDNALPDIGNATDEYNRVSEVPNNDGTPSSLFFNLSTKDMLGPTTIVDSMVQCSSTEDSASESPINQHTTASHQEEISSRKPPLILRKKIIASNVTLSTGTQRHEKVLPLLMSSIADNPSRVMPSSSSSTITMASQFLKAKAVSSIPHEPSGSIFNQRNLKNIPLICSKTVKKVKKPTIPSVAQTQVKLSSVSTRPIKPKRVLFMSPSTSTKFKKAVKERAETVSVPKTRKWLKLLSCGTCPHLQPKTLYDFLTHIAFHQKRPNRCVECLVYLPKDEATIAEHWSQFHNESDKFPYCTEVSFNLENIWKCSKCPEKFSSIEEQFRHERRAHQMCIKHVEGEYKCVTCLKKLHSFEEWQLHRAVEHPQIAEMSCFYCDKTFIFKTKEGIDLCNFMERLDHVIDKHPRKQVRPAGPCQLCGMDFDTPKLLNEHRMNFHSIPEENLYPCPIPSCTFARRSSYQLRKHIEFVHTTQKYMCDNCGWSGKRVQMFQRHQFRIHGIVPDGVTPLTCEFEGCSFQSLWNYGIKKHALVHLPENERPFKCEVCGKGFYDKKHFTEHQDIHANKKSKPYQCEICGNSFAVKNYLYIHKRLSHQGRFFPSTHKKKPKRTTSKSVSMKRKCVEASATSISSDLVSPENNHGLSDEPGVAATNIVATTYYDPLPNV
ncbi:unnamed protein product [Orchesella dallaii]|uniref:C2H2-type domain-containing protein n=1 Tax=Orchesella dallaii TaxID=48710 RepID=A0ABP1Q319_9HEXA